MQHADRRETGPHGASPAPRRWGRGTGAVVLISLIFTALMLYKGRSVDRDTAETIFTLRAERLISDLIAPLERHYEFLTQIGHNLLTQEYSGQETPDPNELSSEVFWLPMNAGSRAAPVPRLPPERAADFAVAIKAITPAMRIGSALDNHIMSLALFVPANPLDHRPEGYVLTELELEPVIAQARKNSGLQDIEADIALLPHPAAALPQTVQDDRSLIRNVVIDGQTIVITITRHGSLLPWWQGPMFLSALIAGLSMTALLGVIVAGLERERQVIDHERKQDRRHMEEMANALRMVETDARAAWKMLKDEDVIDGYALWDEDDRLMDASGFILRYLPDATRMDRPSSREVMTALIKRGHVAWPEESLSEADAIEKLCRYRQSSGPLSEMRMTDGQVFLVRTLNLGEKRMARIFTNITQLRQNEEAQRASQALFRTGFESGPSMMVLMDQNLHPLAVNRAFRATLGYSLEQFARLGWTGILHPDEVQGESPVDAITPWLPTIKRFIAADGAVLRGQVRFTPVRDDSGQRLGPLMLTIEDVTSRWIAEERVRYQASLLDQVKNAVLAVDGLDKISYANRAAQELFQWQEHALRGSSVSRLLGPAIVEAIHGGGGDLETEGLTWNGDHFPAAVTIARIVDESGERDGAVLVVSDLTQRRTMDMQLMHSARLATLGEMAASIAHEFNQCLHVIRLAAEALRMDLDDGKLDPPRVTKRADNILAQVDRLTEMVTQMRGISRRDSGTKAQFQVAVAVDGAVRMVEPLLRGDGIALTQGGDRLDGIAVLGHPVRLEQVLLNLLNNARDAILEMRQRPNLPIRPGTITVSASVHAEDGTVALHVTDDGPGIPANVAVHIFDPFVTTKDENRGCGLGLSISRSICSEMGGSLTFRNPPEGAEFVIELPIAQSADPPPPPCRPALPSRPAASQDPAFPSPRVPEGTVAASRGDLSDKEDGVANDEDDFLGPPRILVVDDEELSALMVGEYLTRLGYMVQTARDGLDALEFCEQTVYDAVVTDIRMPRMDGHELIRRLEDLQPGTPVIVITGHLKADSAPDLGRAVSVVLPKPFQLIELRDALTKALARSEPQDLPEQESKGD